MKQREKILLAALVGILVLWQGGAALNAFVFAPVEERETDIAARTKRVADKKLQLAESRNAADKLKVWNKRSLPGNPVVATSRYQVWLIELATKTKLANVVVTPNAASARRKEETYSVISATVKAQGTLERLCDFLYEFRRCGLLHRVARISLATDQHQGDPVLDIDLTVEGLALKDAPVRTTLFSDPNLADLPGVKPARDRKTYSQLLARNLFVRGYNGPPRPSGPSGRVGPGTPAVLDEDPRDFVYLVGSFSTGGRFDATVRDMSTDKTVRFEEGADFSFAGIEGKVVAIGIDYMILEIKGEAWRLELGDNLAQLKKVPPPARSATSSSDAADDRDAG
ncbi:MAG: hypothetical protein ACM3U2_01115 [Deltaproteobacteria bacterium]